MNFKSAILATSIVLVFAGCSGKSTKVEYNQSASYWYEEMIKSIANNDLEKAESFYLSLSSEHVASPLLKEALLILAQAHIDNEEYLLANKYLDDYIKRFGNSSRNEYAKYLKIKANYSSFSKPNRNQMLIENTINDTKKFINTYPDSAYIPTINSMLVHMELGEYLVTQNIASLYKRIGKDEASNFYIEKLTTSNLKDTQIIKPKIPWYRKWFE